MKKILLIILYLPLFLWASFFEEEDPGHFYHVNVITGHLELKFVDLNLKSPVPFSISRSYTSAGALERTPDDIDLDLKELRRSEWMLNGGWSLISHAQILVQNNYSVCPVIYTQGSNFGGFTKYTESKRPKDIPRVRHHFYLKTSSDSPKASGKISSRRKKRNSYLMVGMPQHHENAIHYLADGTERYYLGRAFEGESFWKLDYEVVPSGHIIQYNYCFSNAIYYPESEHLEKIEIKNPSGEKVFATIDFDQSSYETNKQLYITSSDGQKVTYQMGEDFKNRSYLEEMNSNAKAKEVFFYSPGRKGIGARLGGMSFEDKEQFRVEYYPPETKQKEKNWIGKVKPHLQGDKVKKLQVFDPIKGEFVDFATFSYKKKETEVKDCEGNIIRYYHEDRRLNEIEHYDQDSVLHSKVVLKWDEGDLVRKILFDGSGKRIFQKLFTYDHLGNVKEEAWRDHVTHLPDIVREFLYSDRGLVLNASERGGLAVSYKYKGDTDLVTQKITFDAGKIAFRESFEYDEDHLLIAKIKDDGPHFDIDNLEGATFREIQRFELDSSTGLCKVLTKAYHDFESGCERTAFQQFLHYNDKREVIRIDQTFGASTEKYSTHYEYDEQGHLIKKVSPLGKTSTYSYDSFGNLLSSKEPKSAEKTYGYDEAGRLQSCQEAGEFTFSEYDLKGRLLKQIDTRGNAIEQVYDSFGHCIETNFPKSMDAQGEIYHPVAKMSYDVQGNIIECSDPLGHTTYTQYNCLRKPVHIQYPDLSEIQYFYDRAGQLSKVIQPNGVEVHFIYDPFQRMTSKKTFSTRGELLSEESWVFNTFHLLSHISVLGLTTHYEYDYLGRKISERAGDREIHFEYDKFGHLERTIKGDWSIVQKHNVEGEVVEQWEENAVGKIENHMFFIYNSEGLKETAIRVTSKGEAEDYFEYDEKCRLIKHVDPKGFATQFLFEEVINSLQQKVERKTTIDPLGNSQSETFDANGHLIRIEKKDADSNRCALEEHFYDRAGNKAKREVSVYQDGAFVRTHTTLWEHNPKGLVIKQVEEGKKTTLFSYDLMGRITGKHLPSGVTIFYSYDELGRMTETKSSDGTIHYTYTYKKSDKPHFAMDIIDGTTWKREYNLFGELVAETIPIGRKTLWEYNQKGFCQRISLPDQSSIEYEYEGSHLTKVHRNSRDGICRYSHSYTQFDENGHVSEENLIFSHGTISTSHDLLERVETCRTPWNEQSLEYGPTGLVTKAENSFFATKTYEYDPLKQILREGGIEHNFDSLGNPEKAEVNTLNQINFLDDWSFRYDENGNTDSQEKGHQFVNYQYDALDRLISFRTNDKNVQYKYDPFSRLFSKTIAKKESSYFGESTSRKTAFYLYNKDNEIGTMNPEGKIQELKVLGLGLLGEIGAAIALETDQEVYCPLHDLAGSIIALVNEEGAIVGKCEMDAFGKNALSATSTTPWRFQSKRTEEHLIFFGKRFYDPFLGRWLTPDPSGFVDSPNLYVYVLNSPLNRLDLFGLESEEFRTEIYITDLSKENTPYVTCIAYFDEIQVDWLIYSNQLIKLKFSPEEQESGKFDLFDHIGELVPKNGMGVGLVSTQNGIKNETPDFHNFGNAVSSCFEGDVLVIAMHNPTKGFFKDVDSTGKERLREATSESIMTEQTFRAISETIGKINPDLYWLHIAHSRAGATGCAAIEGLSDSELKTISDQLLWLGVAPAEPINNNYCKESLNVYSKNDWVTGRLGKQSQKSQAHLPEDQRLYNIEFVDSVDNPYNGFSEHSFTSKTYQSSLNKFVDRMDGKYGFFKKSR